MDWGRFHATLRSVQARAGGTASFHVRATPVNLTAHSLGRLGCLKFVRGWALSTTSSSSGEAVLFGGLSDLISTGSGSWLAVCDIGWLVELTASPSPGQDWMATIRMLRMPDPSWWADNPGRQRPSTLPQFMGSGPLDENRHTFSDPESIAVLPDRTSLIGFEDNARIWQYAGSSAGGAPVKELVGNEELRACPPNEGVETMVLLRSSPTSGDGLFLVMCEGLRADVEVGRRTAVPLYLYALPAARAPRAARARLERVFWYPIVDGLLPSAAVLHPATDRLLVLERVHVRERTIGLR